MVLTELITNNAAAVLLFPWPWRPPPSWGSNPRAFAVAVTIAASTSFVTPIGYQTNTMVYGMGGYRFGDFVRLGLPLPGVAGRHRDLVPSSGRCDGSRVPPARRRAGARRLVPQSHLDQLESEAVFIMREVAAQFERPALLFSGGKDSIVMVHLARKAFWPGPFPFPLLHIDTGHNFHERWTFGTRLAERWGASCWCAEYRTPSTRARAGGDGPHASRNALQTVTLLDALAELKVDAAFGGGRRDEEKARAKERFFSHRDRFGQWDPKNQRPELWNLFNGRRGPGEHFRVFPLSNWTEMDVWQYIAREGIDLPSLYFSHRREVFFRDGQWLARSPWVQLLPGERTRSGPCASHRGRRHLHRRGGEHGRHGGGDHRGDRRGAGHGARRPRRRPPLRGRHGRPQAPGVLLMSVLDEAQAAGYEQAARQYREMDLLRFTTAGSVDDGKSTLIGGCCTTPSPSSPTSSRPSRAPAAAAAKRGSTWPC
jgi:sulfate adenylyltransferase subunit 2